jgi:hypothetical protein
MSYFTFNYHDILLSHFEVKLHMTKYKGGMFLKKLAISSLILILSLTLFNTNIVEAESNLIIYEEEIVLNKDVLYDLAQEKGAIHKESSVNRSVELRDQNDKIINNQHIETQIYEYTQTYKTVKTRTGDIITSNVTTTFYTINTSKLYIADETLDKPDFTPLSDATMSSIIINIGGGGNSDPDFDQNVYDSAWDGSIGVKAYSTVYWNNTTSMGVDAIDYLWAEGGWTIYDYQLDIEPISVLIAQSDTINLTREILYQNVQTSFYYSTPPSWPDIITTIDHLYGVKTECKIIRGGSSWYLTLNNVSGNLTSGP